MPSSSKRNRQRAGGFFAAAVFFFAAVGVVFPEVLETRYAPVKPENLFLGNQASSSSGDDEKISLDLRDIEITEALKYLAQKAHMNVIPTAKVTGRVTLMVNDVSVMDVLDMMVRSNDLAYEKRGDIFNVMTQGEYKDYYGKSFSDIRKVKIFHLKYAVPEQVFNVMDSLKSEIGKNFIDPETGTVIVMDTPECVGQIEIALNALEQKTTIRIFDLKYATAKAVEDQLKVQLDAKRVGSAWADKRTNQIIVQAFPERMKDVEALIAGLDHKTREVLIDARIIKVNLSDDTQRGVEWEGLFNLGKKFGMTYLGSTAFANVNPTTVSGDFTSRTELWNTTHDVGQYPFSGTTTSLTSGSKDTGLDSMHVGMVGKHDFDVLLKYIKTIGKTKILSCPQIMVTNNQDASIHVGERQAYVTTSMTSGQTTTTVSESVTYIDVGVKMTVTPTINDDKYITMHIKPEISSVVGQLLSATGNKIPIIDTATAETSVMVKDGCTIMIGGLNKEEGNIFSQKQTTKNRFQLLILLTPHIVEGDTLTTGQDRDFGVDVTKDKKSYPSITDGSDLSLARIQLRSYQEYQKYSELPPQEERSITFKPLRGI
jgi:type II secretory pathway component GspD/PulD (secretin)